MVDEIPLYAERLLRAEWPVTPWETLFDNHRMLDGDTVACRKESLTSVLFFLIKQNNSRVESSKLVVCVCSVFHFHHGEVIS